MENSHLQVLRTIDKFDKIGRDGVVELLQKPIEGFGAGLDPVQAALIGLFLDAMGPDADKTLVNLTRWFAHATRVMSRVNLMAALEDTQVSGHETAWDRLLSLPANDDETWSNGGRPKNIAWALDDMVETARGVTRARGQEMAALCGNNVDGRA